MDHKAQLARLSAIDDHSGRSVPVRTSKCLGICFQANVVVVQPSQAGRAAGGRPVWLGEITEDKLVEAIDDWIFQGGPGVAPLPAVLADHVTSKDAKKPKKRKKPKHSKAAEKERRKAEKKREKDAARSGGSDKEGKGGKSGKGGGKAKDHKKKDKKAEGSKKEKKTGKAEKKTGKKAEKVGAGKGGKSVKG